MYNDSFADMMLNERKLTEKMKILLYFKKKHNCFFDNTVIFKTEICRMFLEHSKPDVDNNLVLTACLLYACKKSVISFTEEKRRTYYKDEDFIKNIINTIYKKEEHIYVKVQSILKN